jgi:hypothetical protein
VADELRTELRRMLADARTGAPMTDEDAALVERRLRDLGYL